MAKEWRELAAGIEGSGGALYRTMQFQPLMYFDKFPRNFHEAQDLMIQKMYGRTEDFPTQIIPTATLAEGVIGDLARSPYKHTISVSNPLANDMSSWCILIELL